MKRFKRGLAILLSTCMIGGMMPITTSAQESVSGNTVQTEDTAISAIQALIDALPDADSITEDSIEEVTAQLDAIDEAKAELTDEEMAQLDLTRYDAAVAKVMALMGMEGAEKPMTAATVAKPQYFSWDAGQTLDVSKVSAEEINPQVYTMDTKDAVYTITGKNSNRTALRFVISEDCTVILDNTVFTAGLSYQDGTDISDINNVYNGRYLPAHGVFEVAEGKKVTFQLKGTNRIEGKSYQFTGEEKFLGILLNANATVEFTGSGALQMANTIGQRILPNYIWNGASSNVIMTSGTVYCRGFANSAMKADNSTVYTPAEAIKFQYNGGWFYNNYDEKESWHNYYTRNRAVGTVYRVGIPVEQDSSGWIKVGSDGTWSAWSDAYGKGTLYAWQDSTAVSDYYVIYNGKYYHYQSGTYAAGSYTTGAVDVTSDKTTIGGFSGTVTINGKAIGNTDLTFVRNETDGLAYTGTCTTDSNGKYYIALPGGTYMLQNSTEYRFGLSGETETSKDITGNAVAGTVTDLNNNPQKGAIVTVQQGDKTLSAATNSNGKYILFPTAFTESSFAAEAEVLSAEPITASLTWNKTAGVEWNPQIDVSKLSSTVYVDSEDDLVMLSKVADQLHGKTIEIMEDIPLKGKFTGIQLPEILYNKGTSITVHGNGHTISNMTTPLFIGYSSYSNGNLSKGTVSDLHLQGNIQDTTTGIVGALASSVCNCTISNCSFEGSITGSGMVGGLAGYSENTTYKNCSVLLKNMSVTSGTSAGGLCGEYVGDKVYNCYVVIKNMSYSAAVDANQTATGGIGGRIRDIVGSIENSYAIVEKITSVKLFPVLGYQSENNWEPNLAKITYTNNYTCGGSTVFNTPPNSVNQAVDVSKEVVKAAPGSNVSGQKALVDRLNEYVNSNSDQTLKKWGVGKDGYPVFLSLDDVSAENVTVTYDGKPHSITVTGAPDGATITYSTDSTATKTYSAANPQITDVADSKTVYYRVSYNGETVDGSAKVTISKKTLTVQAGNQTITYGDAVPSYTATYTGLVARDNTETFKNSLMYTCTYQQGSDKGSYDIIPSGLSDANYDISYQKGTLTVGVKTIGINWGDTLTFDYDGNKHLPTATATGMVNGDTLKLTVATDSGNAINAGTYTARVTEITGTKAGNYKLPSNATQSYTIRPVSLSAAGIVITGADNLVYTGTAQEPGITVMLGGKILTENTDYTVSYDNNINATTDTSKAKVTITGKGNYKGTAGAKFDIKKAALTVTADNKTIKYGENKPSYTATYAGFVNGEKKNTVGVFGGTLTFACDYVKAGSFGAGNTGAGSADNSKVGTYTIKPSGLTSANYDISFVNGTLTVERATGQVTIEAIGEKTYGDADFALSVDKHGSDGALTYTSDKPEVLTVDSTGNVKLLKAGKAKITVSMAADTNHTAATNSIDITVKKKAAILQVKKIAYTVTYGDDDIDLGLQTEGESAVTYKSTDAAVATAADGKLHIVGAGTATITLSMAESTNYLAKNATISVTVNKAKLTVTAQDKSTDYGTDAPAFTVKYDGFKNADTADKEGVFSGTLGFDCRYKKGDATNGNTGIYDIIPKGLEADNYTIDYVKGTLTVRKAESSVSIKKVASKTYGDAAFALTVTKSGSTVAPEYESSNTSVLTVDADGKVTIKGAGTATVTVTLPADNNHNPATANVSITVKKKALTVTADNKSITYGDASPVYTATYAGFVNGETKDTVGVFDGKLTFACNYVKAGSTDNSKAGTYTIKPSGLTSANYEISFVNGTLTVGRADGQVSIASVVNKTYGDADFALSVDKHGSDGELTYRSDNPEVLTVDSTGNVKLLKAGIAKVTVHMAEGTNYTEALNSIDITVAKKAAILQVKEIAYTATYGDKDIDIGLKTEGESAVTYKSTDDTVATAADGKLHIVGAGDATIKLSMAESTNYLAKDVEITVKVNPAVLTITAENETIDYGTAAPAFTVKYDGFKNADTADKEGVFSGKLGFDCSYKKGDATNGNTGTYDIIPKGLSAKNYTIDYVKGTLTVSTVGSSVSIKEVAEKTYGDAAFALKVTRSGSTAAPKYESSNTSVLTVDADGKVTIKGAGTATVTVTLPADNNHNSATDSVSITVNRKALTVTADNSSITYGDAAPAYTATYDGFVNGETKDTAGVFGGTLTFACDYVKAGNTGAGSTDNSKAGTYTIKPSGLTSANYEISFVNGTLTVGRADGQVSIASVVNKTYGDADFALSVDRHGSDGALTYTSDKPEVLTVDSTGNVKLLKAGTATITVQMAEGTNHTAATNSIDITVAKKAASLQVTKLAYTATYGADDIDIGIKTEGESAVTYKSTDDTVATAADGKLHIVGAGTATITLSMAESTNYLAKEVEITVKVNPATLTITADNKSITYGDAAPAYTATYAGFVNGETETTTGVLNGTLAFECDYVNAGSTDNSKAGTYTIKPSGLTSANYEISFVNGTLTVGRADGQVSIASVVNKTYGDADFALSVDKHGSDGELTYRSDNPEVLTVDGSGNVKLLKAGTAKVTVQMAEGTNYTKASNSIDITIAKKAATLQVTKLAYTATYGADDIDIGIKTEGESAVTYKSTDDTVATAADGKLHIVGAGTATITLSMTESTNYLAKDVEIIVKVNPAVLTITAENKTIDYGTDVPAFTVKYDGFKNADTADKEGVFSGTLGFDCGYKKGDATNGKAGNYDIIPNGLSAKNYVITFVKGALTVKEKAPEPSNASGNNNNTNTNGGRVTGTPNSSKNNDSRNNPGTETKPYIKDDSGKEGWDVISSQLDEAKSGETVTVAMNGTTVVPKDIFDSIKGEDVTLVLDMGDGISWKINGKDITDAAGDIDFGVTVGADAGKSIPVDVINNVTGERYSMNLSLAYDGEFGFTARLTINMESKNTGLYANLFYYNEQTGKLEFVSAGLIDADGNVELEFTHASDYTIVIDAAVMDGGNKDSINTTKDNENAEDNTTIPASNADNAKSDAWNPAIIIIIGICILLIVFGAVIFVRKKSGSEEE